MDVTYKDLLSINETRILLERASLASSSLRSYDESAIKRILQSVSSAALGSAHNLAKMAVEETGFGVVEDKVQKNTFAAKNVLDDVLAQSLIGIISRDEENGLWEVAVPMGIIAAIIPSTNPTSSTIFKTLICLAGRNAVVFSPHPNAANCIAETARICHEAAVNAGAPEGCIGWQTIPTLEGTSELMRHPLTSVILATGGSAMVKAAHASGKPAFGVGPGNVPVYVDRSADVEKAAMLILKGKCFDNGTICASEQSIVADTPIDEPLRKVLIDLGAFFVSSEYVDRLNSLVTPNGRLNPRIVGQPATRIAEWAGIPVPTTTRCLIVELEGVGSSYPLSCEKLSPILAYYTTEGWQAGCERCLELLAYGGQGHSLVIHARDMAVIERFALEKPVARLLVNVSGSQGAIGLDTYLSPSLTLGCGSAGGNITTDNVTAKHLVHIRRVSFGRDVLINKNQPDGSKTQQFADTRYANVPADEAEVIKNVVSKALSEEEYW